MSFITLSSPPPTSNAKTDLYLKETIHGVTSKPKDNGLAVANTNIGSPQQVQPVASTSKIPVVSLDVETISDEVASKLATCLLGHVLYLKNQVPLPVVQLARIKSTKSSPRVVKQRTDLISSFDTLSSHLDTAFTSLSTALARSCSDMLQKDSRTHHRDHKRQSDTSCAYLAIVVGGSIGTAKTKVMYAVDGLELRVWGERRDAEWQDEQLDESSGEEDEQVQDDSDGNVEVPEDSDDDENDSDDVEEEVDNEPTPPPPSPIPPLYVSYAEEQRFLQNAERLLSRTLAASDANGNGLAAEISPTQTHILIYAPRRFKHPEWTPRQNLSASLDSTLSDFLDESGFPSENASNETQDAHAKVKLKKNSKAKRVEGVWITGRGGLSSPRPLSSNTITPIDEEDEMIWWSWNGKLVGFSDW